MSARTSCKSSTMKLLWFSQPVVVRGDTLEFELIDLLVIDCEKVDKSVLVSDSGSTCVKMEIWHFDHVP